ncbi:MAG: hypothetical protein CW716_11755 [Candidatus Bathyarchaeum sp.]|nr:MAG: hypothetical protein CW716_11755 [Candidatus Bathyarchaeum sp.]
MNPKTVVVVVVIFLLVVSAIKTVIPNSDVSKVCRLGYKAACSFTPISTVILIAAAVIVFVAAKKVMWI